MKTFYFSVSINAPKEKVWNSLWEDEFYRKWTAIFHEGSYAVSDWKEGGKIQFLSPDGGGLFSIIDKNIPNEQMIFRHIGIVIDGVEQPESIESKKWSGAMEKYFLTETSGVTTVVVELDTTEESAEYFNEKFPMALNIVKQLSELNN